MDIFEAVRSLVIFAISFVVALFITPFVFNFLHKYGLKKTNIRDEKSAPVFYKYHREKSETPTMGGIIIWGTVLGLALLFLLADFVFDGFASYFNFVNRAETYLPIAAFLLAALVGLADDFLGIRGIGPHGGGLDMKRKLILYTLVALIGAWWFYFRLGWSTIAIPFIGVFDIGWWYIPFFVFIIVATAFSVNESDGLDGLAAGITFFAFGAFAILSFVIHRYDLTAFNAAIIGSLLAFLWYNIHPAKFFMGDTGSMSLGVTLGIIAMQTNSAFFLPFFGFILVVESLSVIAQVVSKKVRKKKIFLSAPIHHHFQGLGWPESQITMRFWIISAVMTIFGLVIFFLSRFA